jgi:hypothetical protein
MRIKSELIEINSSDLILERFVDLSTIGVGKSIFDFLDEEKEYRVNWQSRRTLDIHETLGPFRSSMIFCRLSLINEPLGKLSEQILVETHVSNYLIILYSILISLVQIIILAINSIEGVNTPTIWAIELFCLGNFALICALLWFESRRLNKFVHNRISVINESLNQELAAKQTIETSSL